MDEYRLFFQDWKCWDKFEERVDAINGVYAFRLKNEFGRLVGESNLLYFGKCEQNPRQNKRPGLWHRLNNYRQNSKGASNRLKVLENEIGGKSKIEYAYVVCEHPREVEKELLQNYLLQHFEYPPLNRSS